MPRRNNVVPPELAKLYAELIASKFNFMRAGEHRLKDVLRFVQGRFPQLCDDSVRCEQICRNGSGPEWKHRVRAALGALKSESGPVSKRRRGYWIFNPGQIIYPDEVEPTETFLEGAKRTVMVNAYERDDEARERCIQHFGRRCFVCNFSFEEAYGPVAESLIHVHHLRSLSQIREEYTVDPIQDLRPICPNCHAVMHLRRPNPFSIPELRKLLGERVIRATTPNNGVNPTG